MIGTAAVDAAVAEWGDALRRAIRREDRARLESALFDVQRRQIIGYECYYELAPQLVRELRGAGLGPAEAARRMRRLLTRPYLLQIFELIVNPLLAREQRLLQGGEGADAVARYDAEDLPGLATYASELVRAYRGDPEFGPTAGRDSRQRILEPEEVERCRAALRPAGAEEARAIARMAGAIGLHSVLLHGEHRDGIFDHGPYPGPDGTSLIVREVNDVANEFLPWSTAAVRLPVAGLAVVYAYRDVELRFDLFGGASTEPVDFSGRVEQLAVLARRGGEVVELAADDLAALVGEAQAASAVLFAAVAEWEEPERVLYGAHLYANHFLPFARMLDEHSGEARGAELLRRFVERGREIGAPLVGRPLPSVSGYQAEATAAQAPFFTPSSARRVTEEERR
jgi:hypothetical protein